MKKPPKMWMRDALREGFTALQAGKYDGRRGFFIVTWIKSILDFDAVIVTVRISITPSRVGSGIGLVDQDTGIRFHVIR